MITQLPRWIEYGAFLLATLAGIVNVVGLLGFQHQSVSHVSGTATLFGQGLFSGDEPLLHLAMVLLSFVIGASLSGYMIENTALKLGRNYSVALLLEGVLLLLALFVLEKGSMTGHYFASAACGLQNALITTYSGAIIRTTHLTGVFTDLGLMIGQKLKGKEFDNRRALLYILIITGFVSGGTFGAWLYSLYELKSLIAPAFIAFTLALSYAIYVKKR